jgi:hypothetical protein
MLTCIIRYHIDPTKKDAFTTYARTWGQAIPRCGADLIGYFAPPRRFEYARLWHL